MTDLQTLKDVAFAQYQKQGRYEVLVTNYITDMFEKYDALIAQGYKRAPGAYLTASNMNLSVMQVIHMEKPKKLQDTELKAIYAAIEEDAQ